MKYIYFYFVCAEFSSYGFFVIRIIENTNFLSIIRIHQTVKFAGPRTYTLGNAENYTYMVNSSAAVQFIAENYAYMVNSSAAVQFIVEKLVGTSLQILSRRVLLSRRRCLCNNIFDRYHILC